MNRLADETSPYLRQHRDNPVDWFPWGEEAFAEARRRNVPILLSIGYSACHWCHVMAHECFEDAAVAAVMNATFVNVKVDREERPDLDALYMDAVQAITGRGGWPMTVFLTPSADPFFGGTYFPRDQFLQLMTAVADVWTNRPADVNQNVEGLREALQRSARLTPTDTLPGIDAVNAGFADIARGFDPEWGGFGDAPKFPSTMSIDLIARALYRGAGDDAREVVVTTLDAMASGGIYDHIGGGFARYSVDREWLVPHFEKMLYDQAQFVRVYAHAAALLGDGVYRQVVEETIGYVLRDLRHPDGGFFSAEDADSPDEHGHGHEGLFHTWTIAEVIEVLGEDAPAALDWYEFSLEGNFEGRTIPSRQVHRRELVRPPEVEHARQRLFEARERRPRPALDDKVLTEWNAMMLSALAEAAALFDRDDWRDAAVANAEFLLRELRTPEGRWHRSWQADGTPRARHHALAADHAWLVDAFTRMAELTGQARWIREACAVADVLLDHFWDLEQGGLFTVADDGEALVARQKELTDNATPSANSVAANALYRLGALTGEARYVHQADQILQLLATAMPQAPSAFAHALAAVVLRSEGTTELVIAGDRPDMVKAVQSYWVPDMVLAWGERYESPLWEGRDDGRAYVCRGHVCQLPTADLDEMLLSLR